MIGLVEFGDQRTRIATCTCRSWARDRSGVVRGGPAHGQGRIGEALGRYGEELRRNPEESIRIMGRLLRDADRFGSPG
jgi:hypothetical protein